MDVQSFKLFNFQKSSISKNPTFEVRGAPRRPILEIQYSLEIIILSVMAPGVHLPWKKVEEKKVSLFFGFGTPGLRYDHFVIFMKATNWEPNQENEKTLPTWKGNDLGIKQKVFCNQNPDWNNLGACQSSDFDFC